MVIYQTPDGGIELDVLLEQESIWLNLNQLSALLGRDKSVISRHLRNIFKEEELEHESVVAKNATTASDGKTYQVDYYNLDAIISVGYRVNSKRGTQFRIWATKVLRQHIVQGYTVNQARLGELHQAVKLIADTAERRDLSGDEAKALLAVVGEYSDALGLLDDYDHQRVAKPDTRGKVTYPLEYEEALRIVEQLR
ncbi:MAG: RhuM family protein, partial [Planctomycetota bacterium]|nr:RhuM family protein [Planctomycetota bacterium]